MIGACPQRWLALLLTLCSACEAGDEQTDEAGSEGSDTDSAESGPECPEPDIHILDCGDEALACQAFDDDEDGSVDESSAECVWPVLRDRVPGTRLVVEWGCCDSTTKWSLRIGEGGAVLRQEDEYLNGEPCTPPEELETCTLADASFFEGCIANPTPECYQYAGWLTDCTLATSCE